MSMCSEKRFFVVSVLCFFALTACSPREKVPSPVKSKPAAQVEEKEKPPEFAHKSFPTAAEALEAILRKTKPLAVGFGEFHQQEATKKTLSSLKRFQDMLLPVLAGKTSDLVVETWVSAGNCGKREKTVTKNVDEVTKRPEATEDETVQLLKRAMALEIQPHILNVECDDYEKIMTADGGVDYFELLKLIGRRLGETARQAMERRALEKMGSDVAKRKEETATDVGKEKIVALYGGAIHNDVAPEDEWKDFSFGPGLQEAAYGKYVEVDLYVPEFIKDAETLKALDWFPLFERFASPDHALLIELSPKSYIIVFREGVANTMKTSKEESHGN